MANDRYRPTRGEIGPQYPTVREFMKNRGGPPDPSDHQKDVLSRPADIGDALVTTYVAGQLRQTSPRKVDASVNIAGAGPAAAYNVASSNAVPDEFVYRIHTVLHSATQFDPNLAGSGDVVARVFVCVDTEPVIFDSIRCEGTSVAAAIALDFEQARVIPVDIWAAQGSVISIFTHTDYTGGGAAAGMWHDVVVLGDLIKFDSDLMGRGSGAAPANTAAEFALYLAKYDL